MLTASLARCSSARSRTGRSRATWQPYESRQRSKQEEIEILSADQISAILDGLAGHALHPIAALALASGLRRGELLGLQWADIDLDAATLRVERSVEETRAGLRVKPPKTKRGRRNITLPPEAVAMLRAHRKWQIELRLALGQGGQPSLVFSTIEGGLLSPNGISRSWRQTCGAGSCRAFSSTPCGTHMPRR